MKGLYHFLAEPNKHRIKVKGDSLCQVIMILLRRRMH